MKASKLIADGSELLMLVVNPGLIGGLVLPVMGAIPDGAIVLFSGLGPIEEAQVSLQQRSCLSGFAMPSPGTRCRSS